MSKNEDTYSYNGGWLRSDRFIKRFMAIWGYVVMLYVAAVLTMLVFMLFFGAIFVSIIASIVQSQSMF